LKEEFVKTKFNFNRWIRSKAGIGTLFGLVAVLVIVAILVSQGANLFGTAGLPTQKPSRGYTCLPTCSETDGRMLILPGNQVASFGGSEVWLWVAVPSDATNFTIEIFDGDTAAKANWDSGIVNTVFTLYSDPVMSGYLGSPVASWTSSEMSNNTWFTQTIENVAKAKGPNGGYYYLLRASRANETAGFNAFKVRSSGFLSMGASALTSSTVGVIAAFGGMIDIRSYYPDFVSLTNPGASNYSGGWNFKFFVPNKVSHIEIWDGDFDRGTANDASADTDDPNSIGKPEWAVEATVDERAGIKGAPADNSAVKVLRSGDPVNYTLMDPQGTPIYTNQEPSGTEEWERFVLSAGGRQCTTGSNDLECIDVSTESIEPGFYNLTIQGLDISNAVWLRVNFPICDEEEGCGFTPWTENRCPRTIGYWKNNVKKVRAGTTRGVQETTQSITDGLKYVGFASKLFRGALVTDKTVTINHNSSDPEPLTLEEAYVILMRGVGDKNVYYFSNLDRRTIEARALQQNLATWLNLATNKIGANSIVSIPLPGGTFEGSLLDALRESERLILGGIDLERAKDIADFINNNDFTDLDSGDESKVEADPNTLVCSAYEGGAVPKDKQPPKIAGMPKAPKPSEEPIIPGGDPICNAGNSYNVENTTDNPFYGVKYNYASGTEVKEGGFDTFAYQLPADIVSGMSSIQIEVKAGTESRIISLEEDFSAEIGIGEPIKDADGLYGVSFIGATDNGDGTLTLKFTIYVFGQQSLSHVTFGLPEGQVALNMEGSYTSEQCVAAP
jgi:hypothetical protein